MSLFSLEPIENPWYPDKEKGMDDFWLLYRCNREYTSYLNTPGDKKIKEYKKVIKESKYPCNCSPYTKIQSTYLFFYIGMGKKFVEHGGWANTWELTKLDQDYCDGGEDEGGGCIHIEQSKRWFSPRKAQFFI